MMMREFRRWLAVLTALLLLCGCAAAQVQLDRSGSISLWIHTSAGANVADAQLELYKVGDAVIRNNNLCFDPVNGIAVSLDNPAESALASKLTAAVDEANLAPVLRAVTDSNGSLRFKNVEPGMYLVRQKGFAAKKKKYSEITAFVVCLPMMQEDGSDWNYEIVAQPKVNVLPTASPAPTAKPTDTPATDTKLPQTGVLRWPIPVLGVGGLLLFALGWVLTFAGKRDRNA